MVDLLTNNNVQYNKTNTRNQTDYTITNQDEYQLRRYLERLGGYKVSNATTNKPLNMQQRTTREFIYSPSTNRRFRQDSTQSLNSANNAAVHQRSESLSLPGFPINDELFPEGHILHVPNGWKTELLNSTNFSNIDSLNNFDSSRTSILSTPSEWQTGSVHSPRTNPINFINTTNDILQPSITTTTTGFTNKSLATFNTSPSSAKNTIIEQDNRLNQPEITTTAIRSSSISPQFYNNHGEQQCRIRSTSNDSYNSFIHGSDQLPLVTEASQSSRTDLVHFQQPPLVIKKRLQNDLITYRQNISVRFLKPPTPPPPGPIIIREIQPPPPPPQSPIRYRQRPPQPITPPPLILREAPPPIPPRQPTQVVEKLLPPPARLPRSIVVERLAPLPPKPRDIVIERWLPYRQNPNRRIFYERDIAPYNIVRERNELILHDSPNARIDRQFINQGVVRADPEHYRMQYGAELDSYRSNPQFTYLVDEASRAIPPPSLSAPVPINYPSHISHYSNDNYFNSRSTPYSSSLYGYSSPHNSYDHRNLITNTDITSAFEQRCHATSLHPYSSSTSYRSHSDNLIRVNSDGEFRNVLETLTNGHLS
ncbi:unnamed protein product [Didymodactylos carnosus]|uniref:Uncharacterized protein n=1 Tax=Didymodactylos carnosus TaxID=1234261 RepID=A0A813UA04_9BILA|nr:unnamed protein product [Didymodactylos carnosus]CAF0822465.1 unnamed protein product [Didymodactylos carnosus]CAF3606788.1 unnamed protein product [Didymodactylos carnosus]CAF3606856.1 unnamed protein product [Didymodactylos carnosus]